MPGRWSRAALQRPASREARFPRCPAAAARRGRKEEVVLFEALVAYGPGDALG